METVTERAPLQQQVLAWKRAGDRIAFVPTMGNLHQGHISLVDVARASAERVVASVFVNPTQFGPGEDLDNYPRTLAEDSRQLEDAGCDLLFAPAVKEMYPHGIENAVMLRAPADIADRLEGRFRPGHFDGVVSVVARLFVIVQPDYAVFGEKDFQQLLLIDRMVEDLGFGIKIVPAPTVREASGLAMSSRNSYLPADRIEAAGNLNLVLLAAIREVLEDGQSMAKAESAAVQKLTSYGLRVDYVAIRRACDLAAPEPDDRKLRILAAAWCGSTRLIDNRPFEL